MTQTLLRPSLTTILSSCLHSWPLGRTTSARRWGPLLNTSSRIHTSYFKSECTKLVHLTRGYGSVVWLLSCSLCCEFVSLTTATPCFIGHSMYSARQIHVDVWVIASCSQGVYPFHFQMFTWCPACNRCCHWTMNLHVMDVTEPASCLPEWLLTPTVQGKGFLLLGEFTVIDCVVPWEQWGRYNTALRVVTLDGQLHVTQSEVWQSCLVWLSDF